MYEPPPSMESDRRANDRPQACIACGRTEVEQFLDLGETALANKFVAEAELAEPEARYPLRVGFCHGCGHVQLTEAVPPEAMFEDYLYISSASDTLAAHLHDLSDTLTERRGLGEADLVMDIGCNDGTLLSGFARHGVRTLGVDPARNLAGMLSEKGIDRYSGFFDSDAARQIVRKWGQASVITATNTFPHIPKLDDFVVGIGVALAPGGAFVIELHYLVDMLDQGAFDTIYHEHVSYWALGPMARLFERHGMQIVDAERLPLHHGQLRVTVQRVGEGRVEPSVAEILEMERARAIDQFETYQRFAQNVQRTKKDLHETMRELLARGDRIAGYGAPAKGNTLLSFLELGPETIKYIADRSPLKQGRYTPGSRIPVVAPDRLRADQPDYVVLFAWNFADEILEQQSEYRRLGGKFIIPVPEVRVV
jgi:C-methyltransferase C-terminal domain/Putative zinc binding domain/Methyltransferase domain